MKINWKKYALEFLSIFIAVIAAFALNNWNDNRRELRAESKILSEIVHGLGKDIEDVRLNVMGHEQGISACKFWRRIINNEETNLDTLMQYYFVLTRDFVSIQNTSGYETLKSRGLELIGNDTLRSEIISLYEYDYKTLMKLEEEYAEMQFHDSYFHEINQLIAPAFTYDAKGNMKSLELPLDINEVERKMLMSHLWKIQGNRQFILRSYTEIEQKIIDLKAEIKLELEK